jgi:hypothetical protein
MLASELLAEEPALCPQELHLPFQAATMLGRQPRRQERPRQRERQTCSRFGDGSARTRGSRRLRIPACSGERLEVTSISTAPLSTQDELPLIGIARFKWISKTWNGAPPIPSLFPHAEGGTRDGASRRP